MQRKASERKNRTDVYLSNGKTKNKTKQKKKQNKTQKTWEHPQLMKDGTTSFLKSNLEICAEL